jgi:hypothetical protein
MSRQSDRETLGDGREKAIVGSEHAAPRLGKGENEPVRVLTHWAPAIGPVSRVIHACANCVSALASGEVVFVLAVTRCLAWMNACVPGQRQLNVVDRFIDLAANSVETGSAGKANGVSAMSSHSIATA